MEQIINISVKLLIVSVLKISISGCVRSTTE